MKWAAFFTAAATITMLSICNRICLSSTPHPCAHTQCTQVQLHQHVTGWNEPFCWFAWPAFHFLHPVMHWPSHAILKGFTGDRFCSPPGWSCGTAAFLLPSVGQMFARFNIYEDINFENPRSHRSALSPVGRRKWDGQLSTYTTWNADVATTALLFEVWRLLCASEQKPDTNIDRRQMFMSWRNLMKELSAFRARKNRRKSHTEGGQEGTCKWSLHETFISATIITGRWLPAEHALNDHLAAIVKQQRGQRKGLFWIMTLDLVLIEKQKRAAAASQREIERKKIPFSSPLNPEDHWKCRKG